MTSFVLPWRPDAASVGWWTSLHRCHFHQKRCKCGLQQHSWDSAMNLHWPSAILVVRKMIYSLTNSLPQIHACGSLWQMHTVKMLPLNIGNGHDHLMSRLLSVALTQSSAWRCMVPWLCILEEHWPQVYPKAFQAPSIYCIPFSPFLKLVDRSRRDLGQNPE